jgi:DNA-binding transcriptional ArsR family regulator
MPESPADEARTRSENRLSGTSYRAYRYMLKHREPVGASKVQKDLGLSSPSVSEYHLKKLLELGLIREESGGYQVDKVVFSNIVRIRQVSVPIQTAYVTFFSVTLFILLLVLRPSPVTSLYFFALLVNCSSLIISIYETIKTLRNI